MKKSELSVVTSEMKQDSDPQEDLQGHLRQHVKMRGKIVNGISLKSRPLHKLLSGSIDSISGPRCVTQAHVINAVALAGTR